MPIRIENPLEVGADRLVNAIAAYERFGEACVVVDFGTGINIDVVSAEGEYLGGAIGPGLAPSLSALIERAARISRIDLEAPTEAIGRSTRAAIHSGFVFGFAGLIDGIVRRIEEELPNPRLLATGGYAAIVVPFTETIEEVDDMLTLKGLRLIHERNSPTARAD
jgi:type III pantothenate kinase